jgi:MoaA/NifB/PqqE/SkfB family radical SAM enzyme
MKPLTIITSIATIIGTIATIYFGFDKLRELMEYALLPVIFFSLAVFSFVAVIKHYLTSKKIEFFPDRKYAPKLFDIDNMLLFISNHQYNLSVIGRTNISWFRDLSEKQIKLYEKAVQHGCKIEFIIQHKYVNNKYLTKKLNMTIDNDYDVVIKKYKQLINSISKPNNLNLMLTSNPIENSMTKIETFDNRIIYFTYDIGQNILSRPFILFKKDIVFEEFQKKFLDIEAEAIPIEDFEKENKDVKEAIDNLIIEFDQYSPNRNNHNKKLIPYFFRHLRNTEKNEMISPISIQVLITNKCTTECLMCNHSMINSKNELTEPEIKNIIHYINDIGTKNVIISGGEPLYHKFCIDIIEFSKEKYRDLNFGLLTNGIMRGGKSISESEAKRIKNSCSWIQLSIDSFDYDTYKKIRCTDFTLVRDSLVNLENSGANVEVCFTIQKENIDEAIRIIKGEVPLDFKSPIRFKFAHGSVKNDKFLINDPDKIERFYQECKKDNRFNTEYIHKMFDKGYFTPNAISNGNPLADYKKIQELKCFILRYSCKIDAIGNLYPCCFLYDDNHGISKYRDFHEIGKLRQGGSVPIPDGNNNILRDLLFNNRKMDLYVNPKIPVEKDACLSCTRHFYQNEFLTRLDHIVSDHRKIGIEYQYDEEYETNIWI